MNSALVDLTHGRSVTRIAMVIITVILGTALATAPERPPSAAEDLPEAAEGRRTIRRRRRGISPEQRRGFA